MMHENDFRKGTEDEPVPVSSRLLMIPAFLVVCLVVFSVLYGFSIAAKKAASPDRHGTEAPATKKNVDDPNSVQVPGVPQSQPRPQGRRRRPLPGEPAWVRQS